MIGLLIVSFFARKWKSGNKAINLDPYKVEFHASLADLLQRLERVDDALTRYEYTIKLNSSYYPAYINMAKILYDLGRLIYCFGNRAKDNSRS